MLTIGRKWPRSAPRGDYQCICSYCGVQWRRSQMVRDRAGNFACPDDRAGRDVVTLSLLNARDSKHKPTHGIPHDGGTFDQEKPAVPIPGPGIPSP